MIEGARKAAEKRVLGEDVGEGSSQIKEETAVRDRSGVVKVEGRVKGWIRIPLRDIKGRKARWKRGA